MTIFRSPALTIGQQDWRIQLEFPSFKYSREKNIPTWRGLLQPTETSPAYHVKISYRYSNQSSKRPKVWVLSPFIHPAAPHRFPDKSLCLYYPPEGNWNPYKFISQTIIPWTAIWLVFYEIWLDTDHWYGPEVLHHEKKRE